MIRSAINKNVICDPDPFLTIAFTLILNVQISVLLGVGDFNCLSGFSGFIVFIFVRHDFFALIKTFIFVIMTVLPQDKSWTE